ncbi:hypothetical protein ISN76_03450 [Dyella halodurans]|uniref:Uncharacterized protein n=1 Tax=Dyella halodurans TaxID=1920171 RepID=A0ABV9BX99_9GAMM|nr:hypothetical protein [Dyella halodurans]
MVLPFAMIGEDCSIRSDYFVESDVVVGDRVTVKSGVQLWEEPYVDDVLIAADDTLANDRCPQSRVSKGSFRKRW